MHGKIYGLLGKKLGHSYSVPIHKAFGNENYRLFELEPDELQVFLKRPDIGGVNVTIPYKKDVMKFCAEISPEADAVGSANTIVKGKDGRLYAYNTDVYGFEYMAQKADISFFGKKVVILGSGGAYLAVKAASKNMGAREIICISRNGEDNYKNISRHKDADIVVNATPVGMYPDNGKSPVDLSLFEKCTGALDLIYNPMRTAFLMQAKKLGIPYIGGLSMLVAQAKAAEEYFFDISIDTEAIDKITYNLGHSTENIILIGMPGCGKTSIGAELSKITGRESIDTDKLIELRAGMSIPEIFDRYGEGEFRRMERETVEEAGKGSGRIIMTGGGVVKDIRNYAPLLQNGRIYHVIRDINKLERDGRPLSQGSDLFKMYEERLPLYINFRDKHIDNNSTPGNAARKIWRDFCENTRY